MEEGDIIYVDYDLKIKESGDIYRTTREEVAKESDIYDEKEDYSPIAMVMGQGEEPVGFINALEDMKVDSEKEFEVTKEDGYGDRKPELIERVSLRKVLKLPQFKDEKSYPMPGMQIFMNGKIGQITTVGAGRVRVDYNHPLAGRDLIYNVKIVKKADDDISIAEAIFEIYYKKEAKPKVEIVDGMAKIVLPEMCKYDTVWIQKKFLIVAFLRKHLSIDNFQLIEDYSQPPPSKDDKEEEVEEKAVEETAEKIETGSEEKPEEENKE